MLLPLFINERNGLERALVLRGRSLPFKGAVLVEDEMKMEVTFFPGNPVAYSQILGPQLTRTTFTGKWQDKYLSREQDAPAVANFPQVTAAGMPPQAGANIVSGQTFLSAGAFPGTQQLRLAKTVRDAFRLLLRSGAHMRVEWNDWVRYGHMARFQARPDADDEWIWEVEFQWTGDTEAQPQAYLPDLNVKSFIDVLENLADSLNSLLNIPGLVAQRTFGAVVSDIDALGVQVQRLLKILSGFVDFTFLPMQQLAGVKSQAFAIRKAVLDLFAKLRAADGRLGGAARRDVGDTWQSELLARKVRQILALMAQEIAERLGQIEANTAGRIERVYQVESVTSLQQISLEVYGNPANWRQIANFNGRASQFVEAGAVLRIPKLGG